MPAVPRLTITRAAQKQLAGVPSHARTVIAGKIEQLAADPRALANVVKRLQGRPELSLRVGDWRVLYVEQGEAIEVRAVAHRREVYR
jgi:mRNA interferase RelE/StbE